ALGLEAAVADELRPRRNHPADGVRVEHLAAGLADGVQHVGHDAQEGAERRAGLDAVLATRPGPRKDARDLLEVVQEETLRRIAEAIGLPAAERVERREDALQLLGERRLRHPARLIRCEGFSLVCLALIVTKSSTTWSGVSRSKTTAGTCTSLAWPAVISWWRASSRCCPSSARSAPSSPGISSTPSTRWVL